MYQYKVMCFMVDHDALNITENNTIYDPKGYELVQKMESALNEAAIEGWKVVTCHTISAGQYSRKYDQQSRSDYVISGFSSTRFVLVILENNL